MLGATNPTTFGKVADTLYGFMSTNFGWFYLLTVFSLIVFLTVLAFSKYGSIRIGGDKERPDYPFFTWIGMLFSAGFGVGLVFWGVAERMSHCFIPVVVGLETLAPEKAW